MEVSDALVHMCVLLACHTAAATYVPHRRVPHLYAPDFFRLLRFHAMELSRQGHEGVAHHAEALRRGEFPNNPIEMAQDLGLDVEHLMRREPPDVLLASRVCPCGLCAGVREASSVRWSGWTPEAPADQMLKEMVDDCRAMVLGSRDDDDGCKTGC